ncbi:MAG: VOC family protein [Acidimicrobiales bacterium]
MATRDFSPIGAPCWIDLMTSDTERARSFYSQLLGWTAEQPSEEFGGYFMFTKDGQPMGGAMPSHGSRMDGANVWSIYLCTDDARKTAEVAGSAGGQVIVPPMEVGDMGTMAVVTDPAGAAIGMWQPGTFHGFTTYSENQTPSWFELHTKGYDAALGFYRDVFHWNTETASDTPEFKYTTLNAEGQMLAGVMDASGYLPEAAASFWTVYFGVPDADATAAKAAELGGSVVEPPVDTPYGRMGTLADPNGARFKIIQDTVSAA